MARNARSRAFFTLGASSAAEALYLVDAKLIPAEEAAEEILIADTGFDGRVIGTSGVW